MDIPGLNHTLRSLDRLHALDLLLRARALWPRRSMVVLTYHRILQPGTDLDEGVVSASAEEFDQHLALIKRHSNVVSVETLCRALDHGVALPDNAVMITFDDGYLDNHDTALPLLLRHGLTAVFFVTTGYIGTGQLPWWDRVSYIVKRTQVPVLRLRYPAPLQLDLRTGVKLYQSRRMLLRTVKQVYRLDYGRFFRELEEAAEVHVDQDRLADGLFMDWPQVRALHQAGMDVGAHSHTHKVLQTMSLHDAEEDLRCSRRIMQEQLGQAPRAIAYPVGFPVSVGLREIIRHVGFEVGFVFTRGVIPTHRLAARGPGGADRYNLPRMSVEAGHGPWFKAALLAPSLL